MAHYREYRAVCEDMARLKHKLGELGLFETPIRMPDEKLWPDCPLCQESIVKCECDPELYGAAVYAKLSREASRG